MRRSLSIITICSILSTPLVLLMSTVVTAQVMSGDNFQIESDSLNFGGGFSASDEYAIKDTLGEIATGESESDGFILRAGYRQLQSVFLSMSEPVAVQMSPSIPGVIGGFSFGSTSVTVVTDNVAGYELLIRSESSPAMQGPGTATIGDYEETGVADFEFATSSSMSHFGFSVVGEDVASRFRHNVEEECGSGDINTAFRCWVGLSDSSELVARRSGNNQPDGTQTVINFQVGIGDSVNQAPGVYVATTTLTALPL